MHFKSLIKVAREGDLRVLLNLRLRYDPSSRATVAETSYTLVSDDNPEGAFHGDELSDVLVVLDSVLDLSADFVGKSRIQGVKAQVIAFRDTLPTYYEE